MTRWLTLATVLLGACDVCAPTTIETAKFVPVAQLHDAFIACANRGDCAPLCIAAFGLGAEDQLESCALTQFVVTGGVVTVRYTQPQTCAGDSGGDVVIFDGTGDDPCSDGACDPPPDDPCSDGSCDPPPDDPPPDDPPPDDPPPDGSSLRATQRPAMPALQPSAKTR